MPTSDNTRNATSASGGNTFTSFIENHLVLVIGGVVIVGLLIASRLKGNNSQGQNAQTSPYSTPFNQFGAYSPYGSYMGGNYNGVYNPYGGTYYGGVDPYTGQPYSNSGIINPLTGQPTLYYPTSTAYTTNNIGAIDNNTSQAPQTLTVNASNAMNSPTTVNPTKILSVTPVVPVTANVAPATVVNNPTPAPMQTVSGPTPPPTAQKSMQWTGSYTVQAGDTLSGIAGMVTNNLRAMGAPPTTVVTFNDLYSKNQNTINTTANRHGNPIPGGPQNNIFPGEVFITPVWG